MADNMPSTTLAELLARLHTHGPDTQRLLETLSLYKVFHSEAFEQLEEKILAAMGLFYKVASPNSLYAFLIRQMGEAHRLESGVVLTPVQASVRRALGENQFISISAPTSAGKSYSIRDFIASENGDAVVVVPSRALIAEYLSVMRLAFASDKNVMIMPFVDHVFTQRPLRRIFVLTPERARDLFEMREQLAVTTFFFDEAQISEEAERGVVFDVLIRRVNGAFPNAKLVFAHPFVDNPEAQFSKHHLPENRAFARTYPYGAVGKVFVFGHSNGSDYYFSPYEEGGHLLKNCLTFEGDFAEFALSSGHSVLVYVTKNSIYNQSFLEGFSEFINRFDEVAHPKAIEIVSAIEHLLGADQRGHYSKMVELLRKGVVIHHGSVPLEVRFLIEEFVRQGHARICFATSTLVQGVNMPFDVVWLDTSRLLGKDDSAKSLAFKNLIGRAGRLTDAQKFDFGYVYTKNPQMLAERLEHSFVLSEASLIDADELPADFDMSELLEAIREGTFDEQLHIPQSKAERLERLEVRSAASAVLDIVYANGYELSRSLRGGSNRRARLKVEENLRVIYEASLDRHLRPGEQAIFHTAIGLMIQTFQGRSFSEIVGLRFSRIARRDQRHAGEAMFAQKANALPDASLENLFPLFPKGTLAKNVNYDAVVFDTYDYLDQVISFGLNDVFTAAFKIYYAFSNDIRALKLIELMRFGTNDAMQVLLMRYGFLPEDVAELLPYIQTISEKEIVFKPSVSDASQHIRDLTEWYR
ncbi:DEAD/DEAH box helicase [Luteimonas gilva]|nr:DEAD/DEAH box helicase [Luteimonas gilva]